MEGNIIHLFVHAFLTLTCSYVYMAFLSPRHLASGSGDTTVRFWDVSTETPHFTCQGKSI